MVRCLTQNCVRQRSRGTFRAHSGAGWLGGKGKGWPVPPPSKQANKQKNPVNSREAKHRSKLSEGLRGF